MRRPWLLLWMTPPKQQESLFIYCFTFESLFLEFLRHIFSSFSRIIGNLFLICIRSLRGPSKEQTGSWFLIWIFSDCSHSTHFMWKTVNLLIYREQCNNYFTSKPEWCLLSNLVCMLKAVEVFFFLIGPIKCETLADDWSN